MVTTFPPQKQGADTGEIKSVVQAAILDRTIYEINYSAVSTYSDLPAASTKANETYIVKGASGTWLLGSKKKAGLYYSNGVEWTYMGNNVSIDDTLASNESVWSSAKVLNSTIPASVAVAKEIIIKANNSDNSGTNVGNYNKLRVLNYDPNTSTAGNYIEFGQNTGSFTTPRYKSSGISFGTIGNTTDDNLTNVAYDLGNHQAFSFKRVYDENVSGQNIEYMRFSGEYNYATSAVSQNVLMGLIYENLKDKLQVNGNIFATGKLKGNEISTGKLTVKKNILDNVTLDGTITLTADNATSGIAFSIDGTKCYTIDLTDDKIYQRNMSVAWDMSTASAPVTHTATLNTMAGNANAQGVSLSSDGTKVYTIDSTSKKVYMYSLSTAFDISTISYTNSLDLSTFVDMYGLLPSEGLPTWVEATISSDGLVMWLLDTNYDYIHAITLNVAYSLADGYTPTGRMLTERASTAKSFSWFNDGKNMVIANVASNADAPIVQYSFSTPYDINTHEFDYLTDFNRMWSESDTANNNIVGTYVKNDGSKMFFVDTTLDKIYYATVNPQNTLVNGTIESPDGFIIVSPTGVRFRLVVDETGVLDTEEV